MSTTLTSRTPPRASDARRPAPPAWRASPTITPALITGLAMIAASLAAITAAAGLLWPAGTATGSVPFTSAFGQAVDLYGQGLYRYNSVFIGASNRGTDAVMLGLGVPGLLLATLAYRRAALRGALLLLAALGVVLYVAASYALGTAFNPLFLVYVALFSTSLFALVLVLASLDRSALAASLAPGLPRRGLGVFMIASGLVTLVIWLGPLLEALAQGHPPALLGSAITSVTDVLDLGIITPATIIAGVLVLRRVALGLALATALLGLEIMLAPLIMAQTISQLAAGVTFTPAQIVGPISGFLILAVIGLWALTAVLRHVVPAPDEAA